MVFRIGGKFHVLSPSTVLQNEDPSWKEVEDTGDTNPPLEGFEGWNMHQSGTGTSYLDGDNGALKCGDSTPSETYRLRYKSGFSITSAPFTWETRFKLNNDGLRTDDKAICRLQSYQGTYAVFCNIRSDGLYYQQGASTFIKIQDFTWQVGSWYRVRLISSESQKCKVQIWDEDNSTLYTSSEVTDCYGASGYGGNIYVGPYNYTADPNETDITYDYVKAIDSEELWSLG